MKKWWSAFISALLWGVLGNASEVIAERAPYSGIDSGFPASETALEAMRERADVGAERSHMWSVWEGLTRAKSNVELPAFLTWYGASEVFSDSEKMASTERDLRHALLVTVSHRGPDPASAPPLIVYAHYNRAAYRHIREYRLHLASGLAAIDASARRSGQILQFPPFPRNAVVLKTVWWPVSDDAATPLPVWDPAENPARTSGNNYLTWSRVVAISTKISGVSDQRNDVELLGRRFSSARSVGTDAFYRLVLDQALADQVMRDPAAKKLALMLLGRKLRARDTLVLVAVHVATREVPDWVWGTFWWHDFPNNGRFAAGRPRGLAEPWAHYLMDVSFDTDKPLEPDGSPHIAFNPYLEARFGDAGHGSGVVSNCMTCHRRASMGFVTPFLVTRGKEDTATKRDALKTSSLWTIPIQAH